MGKRKKELGTMDAMADDGVRLVQWRLVPDPTMSDAEYFAQRQANDGPHVGKAHAQVNMIGLIGGLARIKGRTPAQEQAAAHYRLLHERAQIGGARAIDYAAVRVDTSGSPGGLVLEIGEEARGDYADAVRYLGMMRSSLVERIIVHDMSLRDVAGGGGRRVADARVRLLDALDALAVHFRLSGPVRA